ncbi:Uncharacterised protein [Legionella busanensis]|uniref:Uncharacterized protein n=1 Tax=Legionella busanensis TaxID=190655 RepID=A0A378JIB5_9GAMM|nr:Uncharacterised protein [Legionella busanensis]
MTRIFLNHQIQLIQFNLEQFLNILFVFKSNINLNLNTLGLLKQSLSFQKYNAAHIV